MIGKVTHKQEWNSGKGYFFVVDHMKYYCYRCPENEFFEIGDHIEFTEMGNLKNLGTAKFATNVEKKYLGDLIPPRLRPLADKCKKLEF